MCPPSSVCPNASPRWGTSLWACSSTSLLFSPQRCFTTKKTQRSQLFCLAVALTGKPQRPQHKQLLNHPMGSRQRDHKSPVETGNGLTFPYKVTIPQFSSELQGVKNCDWGGEPGFCLPHHHPLQTQWEPLETYDKGTVFIIMHSRYIQMHYV